jgi:hypothetical protein
MAEDPVRATECIAPYAENHFTDPVVRQRMLTLSILARLSIASNDLSRLRDLTPLLEHSLRLRRSTGPHDFHVGSYARSLAALGDAAAAVEYVKAFVGFSRRDRTHPSAELQRLLRS